ncbi:MAG: rhodanese-like domain-containing protein [Bdellovibrionota bacterium]
MRNSLIKLRFSKALLALGVIGLFSACVVSSAPQVTAKIGRQKVTNGALLFDVRSPEEFADGHVAGAKNVPHGEVVERISEFGADKDREIVLYCASGRRAELARQVLQAQGYTHVYSAQGYKDWIEETK